MLNVIDKRSEDGREKKKGSSGGRGRDTKISVTTKRSKREFVVVDLLEMPERQDGKETLSDGVGLPG